MHYKCCLIILQWYNTICIEDTSVLRYMYRGRQAISCSCCCYSYYHCWWHCVSLIMRTRLRFFLCLCFMWCSSIVSNDLESGNKTEETTESMYIHLSLSHTHTHAHTHMRTRTRTHTVIQSHRCMHARTHELAHTWNTHTVTDKHINIDTQIDKQTDRQTYTRIQTHMHRNTQTDTDTHLHG